MGHFFLYFPLNQPHCYDEQNSIQPAGMASSSLHGLVDCWIFLEHLDGRENLPHRNFNVRQKSNLPRTGQVAIL